MEHAPEVDASIEDGDDAPETPAPLFAVRALWQAILGTPKQGETVKRTSHPRSRVLPRDVDSRAGKATSKSTASNDSKRLYPADTTPLNSPMKRPGILVTPGTAGKGRKIVSFEAGQPNLQPKVPTATAQQMYATPKDIPGRYPSPWVAKDQTGANAGNTNLYARDTRRQSDSRSGNLDVAAPHQQNMLKEAQADSKENGEKSEDTDYNNPRSATGRFWKSTHETYARKSEVQLRKVVKKAQLAKKFAKFKDTEAANLKEELDMERKKVELLEAKVDEYVRRLESAVTNAARAGSQQQLEQRSGRCNHGLGNSTRRTERPANLVANENAAKLEPETNPTKPDVLPARNRPKSHRSIDHFTIASTKARPSSSQNLQSTTKKAADEHVSSDIWADMEENITPKPDLSIPFKAARDRPKEIAIQGSMNALRPTTKQREPLRSTTGNVLEPKPSQRTDKRGVESKNAKSEDPKRRDGAMSLERKEAARKRLEEKKRIRGNGLLGNADVL